MDSNLLNLNKMLEQRNKTLLETLEKRDAELASLRAKSTASSNTRPHANGGSSGSWTQSDLCHAFAMKRAYTPLYNHMRNKYGISLPKDGVIDDFIQSIHLGRGVQTTMINILQHDAEMMEEHEKLAILQTSIIRLSDIYEYNEDLDAIWGPHKFAVAIVANGLYRDWHQLVSLNFDVRVNKTTLHTVIEALYNAGITVVGCTCSFEDGQPNIWAELDVSYGRNYFPHPVTSAPIYAFYFLDDLLASANKQYMEGNLAIDNQTLVKETVLQVIQRIFRRVAVDKELLEWTDDGDSVNCRATKKFFSQYTMDMLRVASPDDAAAKATAEFINIIKSFADIMRRDRIVDVESNHVNFDSFLEYQSKKLDRVHARLFKIQCNVSDQQNIQFREAIMMTIVSLKLLQTSQLRRYKYSTFCTHNITNEYLKERFNAICTNYNFEPILPPTQTFRVFKDIFLGENCSIKLEAKQKFFYKGKVDGTNENEYVRLLFDWLISVYRNKHPTRIDDNVMRNKFEKMEEMFRARQDPNFRIRDGVINRLTKKLTNHGFGVPNDLIQHFVVQRHLLRVKFLNENGICSIPHDVFGQNSSIVDTITLDE